jgi:hypothetical protein
MVGLILAKFSKEEIEERLFKSQERKSGQKIPPKIKKMKNISAHRER